MTEHTSARPRGYVIGLKSEFSVFKSNYLKKKLWKCTGSERPKVNKIRTEIKENRKESKALKKKCLHWPHFNNNIYNIYLKSEAAVIQIIQPQCWVKWVFIHHVIIRHSQVKIKGCRDKKDLKKTHVFHLFSLWKAHFTKTDVTRHKLKTEQLLLYTRHIKRLLVVLFRYIWWFLFG